MCTNSYNVPHVHMHLRCQQNALLPYFTVPRDDEEKKHPLELMVVPIYVLVPILSDGALAHRRHRPSDGQVGMSWNVRA